MPIITFNNKSVAALKTNKDREDFWDREERGLLIRVYRSGRKNFEVLYETISGRRGRMKVGDVKTLSLKDARIRARKILQEVSDGKDPSRSKAEVRANGTTFGQFVTRYLEHYARPNLKPRSVKDIEYNYQSEMKQRWD